MTGLARIVAFLFGIALAACTFGQWVGPFNAWELALRGLWRPGVISGDLSLASIGALVCVPVVVLAVGAVRGRVKVTSCCSVDAEHDVRLRDA